MNNVLPPFPSLAAFPVWLSWCFFEFSISIRNTYDTPSSSMGSVVSSLVNVVLAGCALVSSGFLVVWCRRFFSSRGRRGFKGRASRLFSFRKQQPIELLPTHALTRPLLSPNTPNWTDSATSTSMFRRLSFESSRSTHVPYRSHARSWSLGSLNSSDVHGFPEPTRNMQPPLPYSQSAPALNGTLLNISQDAQSYVSSQPVMSLTSPIPCLKPEILSRGVSSSHPEGALEENATQSNMVYTLEDAWKSTESTSVGVFNAPTEIPSPQNPVHDSSTPSSTKSSNIIPDVGESITETDDYEVGPTSPLSHFRSLNIEDCMNPPALTTLRSPSEDFLSHKESNDSRDDSDPTEKLDAACVPLEVDVRARDLTEDICDPASPHLDKIMSPPSSPLDDNPVTCSPVQNPFLLDVASEAELLSIAEPITTSKCLDHGTVSPSQDSYPESPPSSQDDLCRVSGQSSPVSQTSSLFADPDLGTDLSGDEDTSEVLQVVESLSKSELNDSLRDVPPLGTIQPITVALHATPMEDRPVSPLSESEGELDIPDPDLLPLPDLPLSSVPPRPAFGIKSSLDGEENQEIESSQSVGTQDPPTHDVSISIVSPPSEKIALPGSFPEQTTEKSAVDDAASDNQVTSFVEEAQKSRSSIDFALAIQLRPGFGVGADAAWMVRFLMSAFGWLAVLVARTQTEYDSF